MIEFSGYLSGEAEKHFWKKSKAFGMKLFLAAVIIVFPIVLHWTLQLQHYIALGIYGIALVAGVLLILLNPQSKKDKKALTPNRIFTDGETITCVTEKFTETKFIGDEKLVLDYGEFYELVFPFGKVSHNFICQKSLLTSGTLEEFEKLFEGKIVSH